VSHANAPLTSQGRVRLVRRCRTRPVAHVAAKAGVAYRCLSKWKNRYGPAGLADGRARAEVVAPARWRPGRIETRQVFDLPTDLRLEITAHQLVWMRCLRCCTRTKACALSEVDRQVQYRPKVSSLAWAPSSVWLRSRCCRKAHVTLDGIPPGAGGWCRFTALAAFVLVSVVFMTSFAESAPWCHPDGVASSATGASY